MAVVVIGEQLPGPQWLGVGLILAGVVLVQTEAARPAAARSALPAESLGTPAP